MDREVLAIEVATFQHGTNPLLNGALEKEQQLFFPSIRLITEMLLGIR